MAISDKLNYLIETKQLFKDRLNSLGAEIIESTTFRNYLNWLDNFYIGSANKTDLAKNGVVGRTNQDGEPIPENPIEINNLSGDVEYKVRGKNLFDKDNANYINSYIGQSNTLNGSSFKAYYIPCKENTVYTISKVIGSYFRIATTENLPVVGSVVLQKDITHDTSPSITILTTNNSHYLVFNIRNNSDTLTEQEILDTIQVEQNDHATAYEPYISESFPLGLKSRNLFDESLMTSIGGTIKYIPINVKKDTDYTLSTNSGTSTLANVFLSTTNSGVTTNNNGAMIGQPRTINSGDNNIMYVGYRNDLSPYWVQLEENSIPTDYEPYYDIELCNILDYKDRIYFQNGKFYLEKKNDKIVLDETMTYYKSATTSVDKYYTRLGYTFDSSIPRSAISNRFIYKPNGVAVGQFDYSQNNQWLALFFCYAEYNASTIDDFKNYVKNNETYCIITLPTATTTEITEENYPTLYSQLLSIQEFLIKYKINKEFLLDYSNPEIEY